MNLITAEKARELTEEAKIKNLKYAVDKHIDIINSKIVSEAKFGREFIDYQVKNQEECDAVMDVLKGDPYKYQVEQCTPNTFSSPFTIRIRWWDKENKKEDKK